MTISERIRQARHSSAVYRGVHRTDDERRAAVERVLNGEDVKDVASNTGVSISAVQNWIRWAEGGRFDDEITTELDEGGMHFGN